MPQTLSGIKFQLKFESANWTAIDERSYIKPKGPKLESMPDYLVA